MAASLFQPRLSKSQQNTHTQLSYELPQRIHAAKTYPLRSANGSTIIIYGQENGVKIIWRGGRSFKPPRESHEANKKTNGSKDAVMIIDSDDEVPAEEVFVDNPIFEDEEEEQHPSRLYPKILQVLDLYLGTDVIDVAILPASILNADGTSWRGLDGLKRKIVFAAACADSKVRLITLPLMPPSPISKNRPGFRLNPSLANAGNGAWGETVVELIGHQKPPTGVAMTADFPDRSEQSVGSAQLTGAHIIVASHSRDVSGSLLLFQIPISLPRPVGEPFQTALLSSPAVSISFNPSLSRQRSSHLLVADSTGVCRIYDFRSLVKSPIEELSSGTRTTEQGTWLLSLYPGFQHSKSEGQAQHMGARAGFGRKKIVDAQWVAGGMAIVVLLGDGQWAVWDIEGVGPGFSGGLLGRQGLQGGSTSEFALSGFIESTSRTHTSGPPQISSSKFAPMTPGTRKMTEPFGGKVSGSPIRGQISVVDVPPASPTSPSEESIVFWFGESFSVISNLSKYWTANARKAANGANLFNGTPGGRMTKLDDINLHGERCVGIEQLVKEPGSTGLPSDILIIGEHRFVILEQAAPTQFSVLQKDNRMALVEKSGNTGELDVVGIDQALARMENGSFGSRMKRIL